MSHAPRRVSERRAYRRLLACSFFNRSSHLNAYAVPALLAEVKRLRKHGGCDVNVFARESAVDSYPLAPRPFRLAFLPRVGELIDLDVRQPPMRVEYVVHRIERNCVDLVGTLEQQHTTSSP